MRRHRNAPFRVEAVCFDAKRTLFMPRQSWPKMLEQAIAQVTGHLVDGRVFNQVSSELRSAMNDSWPAEKLKTPAYWITRNRDALVDPRIGIQVSDDQALAIHVTLEASNHDLILTSVRREFFDWLRMKKFPAPVKFVITSNSPYAAVQSLVEFHGLAPYFLSYLTPEVIGASKPAPRYFQGVSRFLGVAPGRTLFIGNQPDTELEAHRSGMHTLILFPDDEPVVWPQPVPEHSPPILYGTKKINRAKAWIDCNFI